MKYVKIIGVLWLCLSIITTTVAQQRRIILSHGFNGNSDTWQAYQPKLGQMLTTVGQQRVDIVNYNSRRGVEAGKQEVAGQVANNNQNIAIVHSMGGLVWRELDRLNPGQKAGGIITLGTPN
jgi:pimeloyl-ACP methyl ester carboxylesterase